MNLKTDILATLTYFDMFDYPLTYSEIFLFLGCKSDDSTFKEVINDLVSSQTIFALDQFYALKNEYLLVTRRKKGNKKAEELLIKAKEVGALLIKFPYVRGIAISGSLSKNFADEHSDIDLFVITKKNRLWIARTIMHIFKKFTFLVNKQHYYCMNYYVDEAQLEIIEKNIFTAIEVATLIPLQGDETLTNFYFSNAWIAGFLPNHTLDHAAKPLKKHSFKSLIETLFNNQFGSWIEKLLMKITAKRWNEKTVMKKINARGTIMGMSASKHFAKPDPKNFQVKLIERYQQNLAKFLLPLRS